MKYIILLADGMADRPLEELGGKTPLEAANTPAMDELAKKSAVGMVRTQVEGYPFGSDIGNMIVLGVDPHTYYTGRAPLETANMGVTLEGNQVAFRCNLVTVKNNIMVDFSSGHITTEEAKALIKLLDKKLGGKDYRFYPGKSYRHIMVMKGGEDLKTTPPHDISGQDIAQYMPKGNKSKQLIQLMQDSVFLLDGHEVNIKRRSDGKNPANMIWLWGQGKKMELPKLKDTYGLTGAVISAVDLVKGIGIIMGMESIDVPGATGYIDTNYEGKASYALKALRKNDFVYLHVEATDEMGHNGDVQGKIQAIEKFDSLIVAPIVEGMKKFGEYKIMVTSDHATPVKVKTHTGEPVPYLIFNPAKSLDSGLTGFTEKGVMEKQGMTFDKGWELFPYFIKEA